VAAPNETQMARARAHTCTRAEERLPGGSSTGGGRTTFLCVCVSGRRDGDGRGVLLPGIMIYTVHSTHRLTARYDGVCAVVVFMMVPITGF